METMQIAPARLCGSVQVPSSKSLAHRAVIAASLCQGKSVLRGVDLNDDVRATLAGMQALGAQAAWQEGRLAVQGLHAGERAQGDCSIDCNESGSTLRFLIPLALALRGKETTFIGRGNLGKRPLDPFFEIMRTQGLPFSHEGDPLCLKVRGLLQSGKFALRGDISSQFLTGLLFALPLLQGDSDIELTTLLQSAGYVELTLDVLRDFGIKVVPTPGGYHVPGGQHYCAGSYAVEGDYSQAAFFLVAGALGSDVAVQGLRADSHQGDRLVMDILQRMGAQFNWTGDTLQCRAPQGLRGTRIDAAQCPDIIPPLAVAAALARGRTEVVNAGRLRIKECDRLSAIAHELGALGAHITEQPDSLIIDGVASLSGGRAFSHQDHRIAMMLAIAATRCDKPVLLQEPGCVSKSYGNFYEDYQKLGGVCGR